MPKIIAGRINVDSRQGIANALFSSVEEIVRREGLGRPCFVQLQVVTPAGDNIVAVWTPSRMTLQFDDEGF